MLHGHEFGLDMGDQTEKSVFVSRLAWKWKCFWTRRKRLVQKLLSFSGSTQAENVLFSLFSCFLTILELRNADYAINDCTDWFQYVFKEQILPHAQANAPSFCSVLSDMAVSLLWKFCENIQKNSNHKNKEHA